MAWGVVLGFVLFGDLPGPWVWVGTAIVVAAGLYILYREEPRPRHRAGERSACPMPRHARRDRAEPPACLGAGIAGDRRRGCSCIASMDVLIKAGSRAEMGFSVLQIFFLFRSFFCAGSDRRG